MPSVAPRSVALLRGKHPLSRQNPALESVSQTDGNTASFQVKSNSNRCQQIQLQDPPPRKENETTGSTWKNILALSNLNRRLRGFELRTKNGKIPVIIALLFFFSALSGCISNDDDDSSSDENDADNNNEGDGGNGDNGGETDNQSSSLPGPITSISIDSGDTTLTLVWAAVEGVEEYDLYKMNFDDTVMTDDMNNDIESCSDPDFNCDSIRSWNAWQTSFLDSTDYDVITNSNGGNQISYSMTGLNNGDEYMFYVVATNGAGSGDPSSIVSDTPRAPELVVNCEWPSKISTDFPGDEDGGGLHSVIVYDLSWNLVQSITDSSILSSRISFTSLDAGKRYIVLCEWNGFGGTLGPLLTAITDVYEYSLEVDVDLHSEMIVSLVTATTSIPDTFTESDLPRPLEDLIVDAGIVTDRIIDYHSSSDFSYRQFESNADRDADAIHSITRESLSLGKPLYTMELEPVNIRAHGGGIDGIRTLAEMLDNPLPPLIEMVMFDRKTSGGQTDIILSDPMMNRWDVSQIGAVSPSVTTGGSKTIFVSTPDILLGGEQQDGWIPAAWSRDFGQSEFVRVVPADYYVTSAVLSPDETMLAFTGMDIDLWEMAYCNLFVYHFSSQTIQSLTNYEDDDWYKAEICDGVTSVTWTPDGGSILYDMHDKKNSNGTNYTIHLEIVDADGSSAPRTLLQKDGWVFGTPAVAPTNDSFVFSCGLENQIFELCQAPMGLDANATWNSSTYFGNLAAEHVGHKFKPSYSVDASRIIFTHVSLNSVGDPQYSFVIIDRFTTEVLAETVAYAGSEVLGSAIFSATEYTLIPRYADGFEYNEFGQVIISSSSDDRYYGSSGYGTYSYHYEIIPAANSMTDAWGNSGYTFAVYSW